ncbi:MAG: M48 family metallopeptidase [Gammaproteobacteria bacterium]|nr:M48 family metallopeptidase [Gammaproteobacteria bacterium]
MKYTRRTPDSTVNLPTRHPLVDLAWLSGGLAGLTIIVFLTAGLIVDALVKYIPSTADNGLANTISTQLEKSFGEAIKEGQLHDETQRLFDTLATYLPADDLRNHKLLVIDDDTVNAMAAPGGVIVVFRGLLEQANSENEVAFVLAHEYGHLYHKHHWQRLGRGLFFGAIMAVVFGQQDAFQSQLGMAPLTGLQQRHNRQDESQADQFALNVVCRHYGHASGATDFFARHANPNDEPGLLSAFMMTHPLSSDRIADLQRRAIDLDCGGGETTPWVR